MSGRPNLMTQDDWRTHSTSRCPVSSDTMVLVCFANGHTSKEPHPACWWPCWEKRGLPTDIASYLEIDEVTR